MMCILCVCLEEDIDGAAFLDLTEADIKSMVPKLGLVKKVMRLQKVICMLELNVSVFGKEGEGIKLCL